VCLVAELADAGVVGFVEVGLRDHAEGCVTSPVGYLEGIFVEPGRRLAGIGRTLAASAESWARDRGCTEMGSDRALDNESSGAFHEAIGYGETARVVCFRKALS
jgi:aminoglycoside 6'-N-acetyltransferase I